MLDELQQCLEKRFCPNYWIPSLNLLGNLREMDYRNALLKIQKIKSKPKYYVANNWLEYTRCLRKNFCFYCGDGYAPTMPETEEIDQSCRLPGYMYPFLCSSDKKSFCCPSARYDYDPVVLDVY